MSPSRKVIFFITFSALLGAGGLIACCKIAFTEATPKPCFLIGVSTCISVGLQFKYFGKRVVTRLTKREHISFWLYLFIKKKSLPFLLKFGCSPLFILWAFIIISDFWACLKISVSCTTFISPEVIMSFNTLPAPTDGNWFESPTIITLVPIATAFKRACISIISIIELSSIIKMSVSIGSSSFLQKVCRLLSSLRNVTPKSLWIVWALWPVASSILLAALPVGAARVTSIPSASESWIMAFIIVVLPVPGPPVITSTPLLIASIIACLCSCAKVIPWL